MKKCGFTLIELLAVIIVLAIIALIATPIIFNVIENAKIKSLENKSYGVIDAVRTQNAENLLNSIDGQVKLEGNVTELAVAGEHPIAGTWTIDDEKGIKIVGLKFASMKDYTCTNFINGKIDGKVTCTKDNSEFDEEVPTISAKQERVEVKKGTDEKVKNYFNVTFGKTGGNVTCEVENVNSLDAGGHTVKCIATGTNGKTAEASVTITVSDTVSLKRAILGNNNSNVIATDQTWTTIWQEGDPSGLYAQTVGNSKTYYFRGQPTNNYIIFAGLKFRIIRINEDGTIRIMLMNGSNSIGYNTFNVTSDTYDKMYYSNSEVKNVLEDWFNEYITENDANKVANGNYFCEQAKVVYDTDRFTVGNANVTDIYTYTPSFNCTTDRNGYGVVNGKVGLITIDELLYAGGGITEPYQDVLCYLNGEHYWTMSPAGFENDTSIAYAWYSLLGEPFSDFVNNSYSVIPVLNLNANTIVTGSGTSADPYIVK